MKTHHLYSALYLPLILISTQGVTDDWTKHWYDNAVVTHPSSYKSQQRGFYTLGGFQARIKLNQDKLMSVSLPYLASGCGGIDAFYGGLSFLDEDYLVQKAENIMQAAPYVAFEMVLKTLSHQLADTIGDALAYADVLNNISLDECAIAQGAVQTVVDITDGKGLSTAHDNILANIYNEEMLKKALSRNRSETTEELNQNKNNPVKDMSDSTSECPKQISEMFAKGSFLENITKLYGYAQYEDILRGMVGDFFIHQAKGLIRVDEVSACSENVDHDIDDVVYGKVQTKTSDGKCKSGTQSNIFAIVNKNLRDISTGLTAGEDISVAYPDAVTFIEKSPLPVIPTLRASVLEGNIDIMAATLQEPISYGLAYRIHKNINSHLTIALYDVMQNLENISQDKCDMEIYRPAITAAVRIKDQLHYQSKSLDDQYRFKLAEFEMLLNIVSILDDGDDINNRKKRTKL